MPDGEMVAIRQPATSSIATAVSGDFAVRLPRPTSAPPRVCRIAVGSGSASWNVAKKQPRCPCPQDGVPGSFSLSARIVRNEVLKQHSGESFRLPCANGPRSKTRPMRGRSHGFRRTNADDRAAVAVVPRQRDRRSQQTVKERRRITRHRYDPGRTNLAGAV
jgi:hypothetical protein